MMYVALRNMPRAVRLPNCMGLRTAAAPQSITVGGCDQLAFAAECSPSGSNFFGSLILRFTRSAILEGSGVSEETKHPTLGSRKPFAQPQVCRGSQVRMNAHEPDACAARPWLLTTTAARQC